MRMEKELKRYFGKDGVRRENKIKILYLVIL